MEADEACLLHQEMADTEIFFFFSARGSTGFWSLSTVRFLTPSATPGSHTQPAAEIL